MNKKISFPIAIIIIVVCTVLVGGIIVWQYLEMRKEEVKEKTENEESQEKSALLLCNDTYSGCNAISVNPCNYNNSIIYRVNYGCTDVPSKYFDSNLNLIADYCWGMPLPNQPEPPKICYDLDKGCQHDKNICEI